MKSEIASGALTILCEQNGARGAVFRETPAGLQLEVASAGLDQAFLDEAKAMWLPCDDPLSSGSLHCFRFPGGVVFLDNVDEARCSPKIRGHLLMAISEDLCSSLGDPVLSLSQRDMQRLRLQAQLERAGWNVSEVARREGVTTRAIHYRMSRLKIKRPGRG